MSVRRMRPIRPRGARDGDAGEDAEVFSARLIGEIPRLRRFATAWLGNAADADDLVQDCIERAIQRRDTLREPERIGGWLFAIMHNLHISNARAHGRRPVGLHSIDEDILQHVPSAERGRMRDLTRAMSRLSDEHRQILLLVGLEGLSYREVADVLGVPIGTVMSRLSRARERLRELMGDHAERRERRAR